MKKILLALIGAAVVAGAGSAVAADMPVKAPLYKAPPPPLRWGGCYAGVEGGGNFGEADVFDLLTGKFITSRFELHGGLLGGTFGCNWQYAPHWVFGIEDDISWTSKTGNSPNLTVATTINTVSENWIDTLRGRVGYAIDRALLYATGGAAFTNSVLGVCGTAGCFSESLDRVGWAAGLGAEWMLAAQWSAKVEYIHAGFGNANYTGMPSPPVDNRRVLLSDDMAVWTNRIQIRMQASSTKAAKLSISLS